MLQLGNCESSTEDTLLSSDRLQLVKSTDELVSGHLAPNHIAPLATLSFGYLFAQ